MAHDRRLERESEQKTQSRENDYTFLINIFLFST